MRISFCKPAGASYYVFLAAHHVFEALSILFYEDFFLQAWFIIFRIVILIRGIFQSSFMRISFCKILANRQSIVDDAKQFFHFQSSFMRISFCKGLRIIRFKRSIPRPKLSILFYEDFFLQGHGKYVSGYHSRVGLPFNPLL